MAESIRPWIAKALVKHDEQYGADMSREVRCGRYVQITQFDTYRTNSSPHAQITGVVSDQVNWVRVTFDVKATDEFERSKYGEPSETLTSHLRAIIVIRTFRFRLAPPPKRKLGDRRPMSRSTSSVSAISSTPDRNGTAAALELPVVWLDVLDWEVKAGDRNEPVYYADAVELGRGKAEDVGRVQRVLRKWWTGEYVRVRSEADDRSSDASQRDPTQPEPVAGPSNYAQTSDVLGRNGQRISPPKPSKSAPPKPKNAGGRTTLIEFLEPYLSGSKKGIPEWIFEMPDGVQEALDDIGIFGLDIGAVNTAEIDVEMTDSPAHPPPRRKTPPLKAAIPPPAIVADDETPFVENIIPPRLTPSPEPAASLPPTGIATLSLIAPPAGQRLPSSKGTPSQPPSSSSRPSGRAAGSSSAAAPSTTTRVRKAASESEDESFIPPGHRQPVRSRVIKDPLAFGGSSQASSQPSRHSSDGEAAGDETDEELLSDYERKVRHHMASAFPPTAHPAEGSLEKGVASTPMPNGTIMPPAGQPTPQIPSTDHAEDEEEEGNGPPENESYSLSASNASREKDLSLSKYAKAPLPSTSGAAAPSVVSPLDEAGDEETEEHGLEQPLGPVLEEDMEEPVPDHHDADDEDEGDENAMEEDQADLITSIEDPADVAPSQRKRSHDNIDATASKRPRSSPPTGDIAAPQLQSLTSESETPNRGVLSYLNPLNLPSPREILRTALRSVSSSPRNATLALPAAPELDPLQWTIYRNPRERSSSTASSRMSVDPPLPASVPGPSQQVLQRQIQAFPMPERTASPPTAGDALRQSSHSHSHSISSKDGRLAKGKQRAVAGPPTTSSSSSRQRHDPPPPKAHPSTVSPKKEKETPSIASSRKVERERETHERPRRLPTPAPRLGGWKPDFTVDGGLDLDYLAEADERIILRARNQPQHQI